MKSRLNFYLFIAALVILDAALIRSPNLLGKIGLFVYKYHYLRTFPKALLTVFLVVGITIIFSETIRFVVKKQLIKNLTGKVLFFLLTALSVALAIKVGLDFSSGSYAHTGLRFRSGAYLLPAILVLVFVYGWLTLPKISLPFPESPVMTDDDNKPSIE
ncbi:MAG TPA: hypothetical protein PLJ60_01950 [Chryseolinea sp.]|nr:hypothetical protein [Chryseolinea sp.]HPM29072.1 hypothetical protein [Chryseolinea sp.]